MLAFMGCAPHFKCIKLRHPCTVSDVTITFTDNLYDTLKLCGKFKYGCAKLDRWRGLPEIVVNMDFPNVAGHEVDHLRNWFCCDD